MHDPLLTMPWLVRRKSKHVYLRSCLCQYHRQCHLDPGKHKHDRHKEETAEIIKVTKAKTITNADENSNGEFFFFRNDWRKTTRLR